MTLPAVDPMVRLQAIAIEVGELQALRQMSWTEATNRASMLMTIVGAAVFGLALVGNATNFDRNFLLFTFLVLFVVLFIAVSSMARIGELEREDGRLVQGLNRLRNARLELDPGLGAYLVLSPYDDAQSVLSAYGAVNPVVHSVSTLAALMSVLISIIAAFLVGVAALLVGVDAGMAALIGAIGFFVTAALVAFVGFRSFNRTLASFRAEYPAPPKDQSPQP